MYRVDILEVWELILDFNFLRMNKLFIFFSFFIFCGLLLTSCRKSDVDEFYELNKRILAKKGIVNSVPNGGNGGGINSEDADTIVNLDLSGDVNDLRSTSFNCPAGISNMTIKTICSMGADCSTWNPNYADMFVRYGTAPVVSNVDFNYIWTADCGSILSNNEEEICNFNQPQAGQWHVALFGYNNYFYSKLLVIVE